MKIDEVRKNAFAMPLNNPAFPRGPYKFYNREFIIVSYRSDPARMRAFVPEPLEVVDDVVHYEFIRMPDSTGFGDYTETGQVIPVRFKAADGTVQEGGYDLLQLLAAAHLLRIKELAELAAQARPSSHTAPLRLRGAAPTLTGSPSEGDDGVALRGR